MRGWTKGHQTHPVLHTSPGQNLVLAWGSENNCKPEVGMANVEKQKLLLSAMIVEKRSVGSPKKKEAYTTQMDTNLWKARASAAKDSNTDGTNAPRAKGDK